MLNQEKRTIFIFTDSYFVMSAQNHAALFEERAPNSPKDRLQDSRNTLSETEVAVTERF